MEIPELQTALEELTKMSTNAETRAAYNARLREMNDIIVRQTVEYKEGLTAGKRQGEEIGEAGGLLKGEGIGRKLGRRDSALETAKNFLSMGLSIDQVARGTGLSLAEVEELVK